MKLAGAEVGLRFLPLASVGLTEAKAGLVSMLWKRPVFAAGERYRARHALSADSLLEARPVSATVLVIAHLASIIPRSAVF